MGKTSQRKFSAYQLGIDDGLCGRGVRWARHPKMEHYMAGYNEGKKVRTLVKRAMVPAKRTKIWGEEYILARLVDEGEEYW